ncbi:MAG: polysaccharide biosynthesis/export family protein [Balneolaceae bacterium]
MREKALPLYALFICTSLPLLFQGCSSTRSVQEEEILEQRVEPPAMLDGAEAEYKIRTGDEIEILIWEQPSFNTLTTVSRLGTIAIPLVGELEVSGLTKEELERLLERELSEYIRGGMNMTVSIRNIDSLMVSVLGMVAQPDNYPVVDQTSIFRILSMAGGPTEIADMRSVRIYKQSGPENYRTLDLMEYLDSGQMNSPELVVHQGDIIFVPKDNNVVREMSEFLRDVVILFGIFRVFN